MLKEIKNIDKIMINYESALKVLETQLEIINNDFKNIKNYNPIEHIKTRIKKPESIINKLRKNNYEITTKNIINHINDVVGVRIICSFESDIYNLIKIIRKSKIINVIKEKDYIKNPKKSGYRSYHLIVSVPVELINEQNLVKAEIQIRTLAMDLWASLDHKLSYKSSFCTKKISNKLITMSEELHKIDQKMSSLIEEEKKIELNTINSL